MFKNGDIVYFPCKGKYYDGIGYGIVIDTFLVKNKRWYYIYSSGIFEIEEKSLHLVKTKDEKCKEFVIKHLIGGNKKFQELAMERLKK